MTDIVYLSKYGGKLSALEDTLLIACIRTFGGTDHPYPSEDTLSGFAIEYCIECLEAALNKEDLQWREGQKEVAVELKQKLSWFMELIDAQQKLESHLIDIEDDAKEVWSDGSVEIYFSKIRGGFFIQGDNGLTSEVYKSLVEAKTHLNDEV